MNLVIPDASVLVELQVLVDNDEAITVRLFKNNVTPTRATVLADLTECDFSGYAGQALAYSGAEVFDAVNHVWYQPCTTLTWTRASGATSNDVYGCYGVDASGRLRFAGRLDGAPASMSVVGQTLSISLNRRSSSEFA